MFSDLIQEVTNWTPFVESVRHYAANLSINSVIVTIMMIFMLLGAIDKAQGNKRGYGAAFDEGFHAMGPLAIAMVGVIAAAPVISMLLRPIIGPIYEMLGSSPSIFATTLLLADSGGYSLAVELAGQDIVMGQFAGIIVGCTMGCILLFDIPVALNLLQKKDRPVLACGILVGTITAPVGCLVGGFIMNLTTDYHMPMTVMLLSLLPVILVAAALAAGLWFKPIALMNGFAKFGAFVTGLIAIFVALAVLQEKTGIHLPLFRLMVEEGANGISPLTNSITILGDIAFILLGAFPMVEWIKRHFGGKLAKLGGKIGINKEASAGIVATLANNIPAFQMVKDMDPKGKLLNIAFASCAAFMFGDHLGFVAGVNETMIVPMIFAKLACGISALVLANLLAPQLLAKAEKAGEQAAREETAEASKG
ncbi:ethanolamine utilization protein EutH [Agathobaculum sp. NTUH-O15-33]|uniref:ethanolamine utilization protein EutH n=1 Tax=Agathobaculum sp. NTUH-O15-33 TaxID=3079302 RepID=UPI00295874FB|nr:ethanolamine utilization protein EutH [Agathobaculum sp. NTUH-O15-33]WNX84430.1 ethanolamine utilization protein EutH [Agathobaculum sp. NTUH-O15-33]